VESERKTPEGGALARWETRAQAAVKTGRRQFVYRWTAPRSPVLTLILVPLFVVAALLAIVLTMFVFAILFAVAIVAVFASRLGLLRRRR
jgi:hypothetical protein